jgi:hypothetical protein
VAEGNTVVTLRTVKRVLALDLGLNADTITSCLGQAAYLSEDLSELTEIPLAEALRIVAMAEALILEPSL